MWVECWGGPLDGDTIDVDELGRDTGEDSPGKTVVLDPKWCFDDDSTGFSHQSLRCRGIYRYNTLKGRWEWEGYAS